MILELDGEFDTIKPKIGKEFILNPKEIENEIIDLSQNKEFGLEALIGKKIIWLWTMTNDQGYKDSIQIELNDHSTYQFMVECSFFKIGKLTELKKPRR
jgi:hypothetical protein